MLEGDGKSRGEGEEIPRKLKRRPTRRPDKERARLIEKICKAGGASWRRLIRIRVSFGLWFRLRVAGSHQEAAENQEMESWRRERERERGGERTGLEHSQSSD